MSADQLAGGIRDAQARARALQSKGWNAGAETALVDRIDELADGFHELAAEGTRMPGTARALLDLLEKTRARYTAVLEKMQADVIREDGDLEAVQDSSAWQQRELLAMRLLYRLDWVRYETAMRYETDVATRKRLLEEARTGFSDFLGSGDTELTIESLLGKGLTSKALKQYDVAIGDLNAALELGPASSVATQIRIALAEAYLASNRLADALGITETLMRGKVGNGPADRETHRQILFLRAKAILVALGSKPGSYSADASRKMRTEAARSLEELYSGGPYWKAKVVQLVDAGMGNPADWSSVPSNDFVTWLIADSLRRQGEYEQAASLYERLLDSDKLRAEALFGLGFCCFHTARYDCAFDNFTTYLSSAAAAEANYPQAAYLRFKSAESAFLQAEGVDKQAAGARYLEALNDFLAKAPDHPYAFEAWFRLGDWQRDHQQYAACGASYAHVQGDPAFELKASYLSAQCYVEEVLAQPESEPVPVEQVRQAVAALDGFSAFAERFKTEHGESQSDLIAPLEAKAVVMGAAIIPRANAGTMDDRLRRLSGFEARFPNERALLPEVLSLRIVAYRTLGRLDEAGSSLETLLSLNDPGAYRVESLKKLGIVFLKEAAKREEEGDAAGAIRSKQVALRVYETLLQDAQSAPKATEPLAGIEKLVADLRAQTATADGQ